MSRYAQFDEDGNQYQISSNLGWSEFGDWVETLDAETYPNLREFWEGGTTQAIPEITAQLEHVLEESPPSKNVNGTAELLLSALHQNQTAGVLLSTS